MSQPRSFEGRRVKRKHGSPVNVVDLCSCCAFPPLDCISRTHLKCPRAAATSLALLLTLGRGAGGLIEGFGGPLVGAFELDSESAIDFPHGRMSFLPPKAGWLGLTG